MSLLEKAKGLLKPEFKVLVAGLEGVGKSAILHRIKHDEAPKNLKPTRGMIPVLVDWKKAKFQFWDLGGAASLRPSWESFYDKVHAVVFVVDSGNRETIDEAKKVLHSLMTEEQLEGAVWLILGNKEDVKNSLKRAELTTRLGLEDFRGKKQWLVEETSEAPSYEVTVPGGPSEVTGGSSYGVLDAFQKLYEKLVGLDEDGEWS